MLRGLEGWHLIVLIALVAILFGSKRLPDAARGLGRSMRILKAEVKEMKDDDGRRAPASGSSAKLPPEPLEGRLVDGEPGRAATPSEQHHDL